MHMPTRHGAVWSRAFSPQQTISQQQSPGGTKAPLRVQLQRSTTRRRNAAPLILSQEMVARARLTVVAEDLTRRRREHSARLGQWKRAIVERARVAELDAMMGAARELLNRQVTVLQMNARRKIMRQESKKTAASPLLALLAPLPITPHPPPSHLYPTAQAPEASVLHDRSLPLVELIGQISSLYAFSI